MTTLRVMTYNMLHAPGDRLAPLVDVVKGVSPDVLACQEVNTFDGMMELSRELDMLPIWGMANSAEDYRDGQPVFEHLVVFTRFATSGRACSPWRPAGHVPTRARGASSASRRSRNYDFHRSFESADRPS